MHTFIYNGKKSQDYNLILSGEDTWKKTMPDVEEETETCSFPTTGTATWN